MENMTRVNKTKTLAKIKETTNGEKIQAHNT